MNVLSPKPCNHARSRTTRTSLAIGAMCFTLGAGLAFCLEAAGGQAQSQQPTIVNAFLSALQHPTPGEFPTPQSAIRYLVEQVRTQNLSGATRVFPISETYDRTHFITLLRTIDSVDLSSFFPKQPLSKLSYATGPLSVSYTQFTMNLLIPGFTARGSVLATTEPARKALIKRLDPSRLKSIFVASMRPFKQYPIGSLEQHNPLQAEVGVIAEGEERFTVGGIGSGHVFDATVEKIGTNWLIQSVY